MLAELMRMKYGIAIGGTHGKTTTTSLLASCLYDAKFDPTVVIGGKLNMLDSSARLGEGDYMVVEADESDGSFLLLNPTISVITNIDPEHLEYWKTEEKFNSGVYKFCSKSTLFWFYSIVFGSSYRSIYHSTYKKKDMHLWSQCTSRCSCH